MKCIIMFYVYYFVLKFKIHLILSKEIQLKIAMSAAINSLEVLKRGLGKIQQEVIDLSSGSCEAPSVYSRDIVTSIARQPKALRAIITAFDSA